MKNIFIALTLLSFVACGKNGKDGVNGQSAGSVSLLSLGVKTTGIDIADMQPGLACSNGGVSIFTYNDSDANGFFDQDETVIKNKVICNGTNGVNGSNGSSSTITLESIAKSATCPQGGVLISSSTAAPVEVCNGLAGLNGAQGLPGAQGIPGMTGATGATGAAGSNGADGTKVTPVKFCKTDNSKFPEYGLIIGDELFAVYWGTTPASPNVPQSFLTKLVAGNYMSTGGNNCLFSIP